MQKLLIQDSFMELFFEKLAIRKYKENDLSDVTWALCESSSQFKKLFLCFFFGEIDGIESANIEREVHSNFGRPDFKVLLNGKEYLIEVKIYDKSHHPEYEKDLNVELIGYITNYNILKIPGAKRSKFIIRNWEDFYKELKSVENNDELIKAYRVYLKSVCHIIKIEKMDLSNLKSLYYFNQTIKDIVAKNQFPDFVIKQDNVSKSFLETGSGFNHYLYENEEPVIWFWFGVLYNENLVEIRIILDKSFKKQIGLIDNITLKETVIYTMSREANELYFSMKDFNLFSSLDKQEQLEKLVDFYKGVMDYLIAFHTDQKKTV